MPLATLAGALYAAGGLTDIDFVLTGATIVLFAVFALVLAKFAWGPLLHMIEEREKGIKDAVDGAERSAAEAKELLEKHREMLREAGREREEIIKRALKEADVLKTDLQTKARSESEAMIGRAKEQVERFSALLAVLPVWAGLVPAASVVALDGRWLLHAGPPLNDPRDPPAPSRRSGLRRGDERRHGPPRARRARGRPRRRAPGGRGPA